MGKGLIEGAMLLCLLIASALSCAVDAQSTPPEPGSRVFLRFCAGCHGFSGFALYPPAPSFSMQERMAKSDAELMWSILKGRNAMPSWEDKLAYAELRAALDYIRYMARAAARDGRPPQVPLPDSFYLFWPPEDGTLSPFAP